MGISRSRPVRRPVRIALLALPLIATMCVVAPAQAGSSRSTDVRLRDLTDQACQVASSTAVAARRDGYQRDGSLPDGVVTAYEKDLATRTAADDARTARLPKRKQRAAAARAARSLVRVAVRVHVIKPSSRSHTVSKAKVKHQISTLNRAFAGKQSKYARNTRFRFALKSIDYTANRSWYTADLGSSAAKTMKARLHQGGRGTLNLYLSAPRARYGNTLGWATFPQRARKAPRSDGVVVNVGTLSGGRFRGYNRGDTAVHETGHWLGLYHTFQGGCGRRNDLVSDTPAEATPSFTCPHGRNSCSSRGLDPIHNFMDYSYDSCMGRFTTKQMDRMRAHWRVYRR